MKERRSHFLINKPLQLRFMFIILSTLLSVSAVILISFYFGIWGSVLNAFSNTQIQEDLINASRLSDYENARLSGRESPSALSYFREADRLSLRQREVFRKILDQTNRELMIQVFVLLILIAWGSIYLSHKIAGPLYRLWASLEEIEKGNMTARIHLRKFDEGHFLEMKFNQTAEQLDQTFSNLKGMTHKHADPQLKAQLLEELRKIKTSGAR